MFTEVGRPVPCKRHHPLAGILDCADAERAEQQGASMTLCFLIVNVIQAAASSSRSDHPAMKDYIELWG